MVLNLSVPLLTNINKESVRKYACGRWELSSLFVFFLPIVPFVVVVLVPRDLVAAS